MTILDALHDPALFGPWFSKHAHWQNWEVFLAALFGIPIVDPAAVATFSTHTGRTAPPTQPAREGWVMGGRRGGKSRIAALAAPYLACCRDYREMLAPGEMGTLPVIAADRRQSRTVMRYITGFVDAVPMLRQRVAARTKETIELTNRGVIEVHTASFRAVRGSSLIGAICDEIAVWQTDDGSANPDVEESVTPMALELVRAVQQEIAPQVDQADRLRHRQVERAQYEADQARYLQVEPANRLVASSLECLTTALV